MKRRTRRKPVKKRSPEKPPVTSIVLEEIDLVDSDQDETPNKLEVTTVKPSTSVTVAEKRVTLTDSDPHLISMLVKHHCIFCLGTKNRTNFSILKNKPEESDGYELLRRYFGTRTADCLNDIFDAAAFTNRALLTAEFPAPLLCESCLGIVGELEVLHENLEGIQRLILRKVKSVRQLVLGNGQGEERRLDFEQDLLDGCGGNEDTLEVMIRILDKFQETLEEETHDHVEINLEHLELVDSLNLEEDLNEYPPKPVKKYSEVSTQTDSVGTYYDLKVVRVSVEETEENGKDGGGDQLQNDNPKSSTVKEKELTDVKQEVPVEDHEEIPRVPSPSTSIFDDDDGDDDNPGTPLEPESCQDDDTPEKVVSEAPSVQVQPEEPEQVALDQVVTPKKKLLESQISPVQVPVSVLKSPIGKGTTPPKIPAIPVASTPVAVKRMSNAALSISPSKQATKLQLKQQQSPSKSRKRKKIETESEEDSEEEDDDSDSEEDSSSDDSESNLSSDESTSSSEDEDDRKTKSIKKNTRTLHELKPFRCILCHQHFPRRWDVYRHIRNIHHTDPASNQNQPSLSIACECNFECDQLIELRDHLKEAHQQHLSWKVLNSCSYECDTCGHAGYSKAGIFRLPAFLDHLREHESRNKILTCEDCHQQFSTKQMYQLHPCPQVGRAPGDTPLLLLEADLEYFRKQSEYLCRFCPQDKFQNEKHLQQHFEAAHKQNQPFLCEICKEESGNEFQSQNCLKTHLIQVHNGVKYKCRICQGENPLEFTKWAELHTHLNFEHFGGYFKCPHCYKKFSQREQAKFVKHQESHQEVVCDLCARPFTSELGLRQHKGKKHPNSEKPENGQVPEEELPREKETAQVTTVKPKKIPGRGSAQYLNPRKNGLPKPFSCKICDYQCCVSKLFRKHMQTKHGILVDRQVQVRTYSCAICGYSNSGKRLKGFIQHLMEHETPRKNFKCEDCSGGFTSQQMYQLHRCVQTGKLPGTQTSGSTDEKESHSCRFCGMLFNAELSLQKHCKKEHQDNNPFSCNLCGGGDTFPNTDKLKSHMISKHGAVAFKCRICIPPKQFSKTFDLFAHMNLEHFGNYYECPHCQKRFVEKLKLESHLASHGEEKGKICSFCGAALKTTGSLRRHIQAFHTEGRKNLVCEFCGKEFNERGNLRTHVRRMHQEGKNKKKSEDDEYEEQPVKKRRTSRRMGNTRDLW